MTNDLSHEEARLGSIYGDWLKQQREKAGLTQQQLAEAAVMTRSHIAHIEAGRRTPSKEDARRLDRALNTGNELSSFLPPGAGARLRRVAPTPRAVPDRRATGLVRGV